MAKNQKSVAKKVAVKGKGAFEALKDAEALKKARAAGGKKSEAGGKKSEKAVEPRLAYSVTKGKIVDMNTGKPVPKKETTVALRADVLPPETASEALLKHPGDETQLHDIETCIQRSLSANRKLDLASTFMGVTIGCALRAAKVIIKPGLYEKWVETSFPNFSERQAQYYGKLSDVFMRETGARLALPPPKEMGTFLMRTDQDNGQFADAIRSFVGNLTMAELLDQYRIKPKKAKGGFRPGSYMVKRYQDENLHLQNKPFEVWSEADQQAFSAWLELEVKENKGSASIVAAEGVWTSLRNELTTQGVTKKSYALLTKDGLSEISRVLGLVKNNIDDALKGMSSK
jgi:hypothetical protein